jgi:hypothetical protein
MATVDRSEYLQQFVTAGVVNGIDQLNRMDESEFRRLLEVLSIIPESRESFQDITAFEAPVKTVEERIAALKVPKNAANVLDELEAGRGMLAPSLELYGATVKPWVIKSRVLGLFS